MSQPSVNYNENREVVDRHPFIAAMMNRRILTCVFTGFASGMPLYLLLQLVPAWLRESGVSLAEIGLFALVGLPYTWKFIWAPLLDRWSMKLGLRRSWMLATQIALIASIGLMGHLDPVAQTAWVASMAAVVAFFSATQDIAIDAYRREILPDEELGLGNSVHVQAYRIASLVPGSLSLILADHLSWPTVFWITAAFMLIGVALSIAVKEPVRSSVEHRSLKDSVVAPFSEYVQRRGWAHLLLAMAFMVLYKLGDNMATALSTPFYLDLGFSKTEIGLVAKNAALWPSIVGGIVGGLAMIRLGINRALWVFGLIQMVSILGFAVLAWVGHDLRWLAIVIAFEYLGVGLGTAAFTAFIARESSRTFAATQFALFTAIAAVPRTFMNATTGFLVERMDWIPFFLLCTFLAVPGMLILIWIAPWSERSDVESSG